MLRELDEYLKSDMLEDYWYDDALFICEDIIREFSDDNWKELEVDIPKEDERWNIRLVECLSDIDNEYALNCIMKMADTDNERLFITCVDSLRDRNISSLQLDDMKNKAKLLLEVTSLPNKKVLEAFIQRV